MIITPQRTWVLVTLEPEATAPENGGLLIVREARPTSTYAHVDAIGPEVRDVRAGARVVISRLQGINIGNGQLVLPESAVLAMEPAPFLEQDDDTVFAEVDVQREYDAAADETDATGVA